MSRASWSKLGGGRLRRDCPRALGLGQGHGVQAPGEGARRVVGLRLHAEAGLRGGGCLRGCLLCSPARTPTPAPCSTRLCKQFPRKASALPQRPRTRTCALRGGTKGTAEPALLRMTLASNGQGPPSITDRLRSTADGAQAAADLIGAGQQFPNAADYPAAPPASPTKPFSVDHMLGPSFVSGGQQVFEFVRMMAHNEVYLRCAQLANASRVLGNLGDDILSKITLKSGVGTIVETGSDDGHFMALRGPVTLRHMRFRLTDLDGNVVRPRGSSLSFVLYLDHV